MHIQEYSLTVWDSVYRSSWNVKAGCVAAQGAAVNLAITKDLSFSSLCFLAWYGTHGSLA